MSGASESGLTVNGLDLAILSALPVGVCLFGVDGRKIAATGSFFTILDLPTEALRHGASLFETLVILAYHGVFGPGDPERQAKAILSADRSEQRRIRHRHRDGRSLELQFSGLPDGRVLVTAANQTPLIERRSQAEAQARRMIDMFESLPIGVAVLDATRTVRLANRRFTELLDCPTDLLPIGMTLQQLSARLKDGCGEVGFSEMPLPWQALEMALNPESDHPLIFKTSEMVHLTGRVLSAGGWVVTASAMAGPVHNQDAAQRRQRLIEQILQALPHGVCLYGPDRRLRLVNRAFIELGWADDPQLGDPFDASPIQTTPPIDPGKPQFLRRYTAGGTPLDVRLIPLADAGFACVTTDITAFAGDDAKPTTLMQQVLLSLPHGVLLWDSKHRLLACNPKAAELLELPPDHLITGRPHAEIMTELASLGVFGGPEDTRTHLQDLLARDRRQSHIHRRSNRAGRVLEVHSDPVPEGGFVVTYSDVTEYRLAEEGLRRGREAAEAASVAKSRFLATMSHELRTPLNAVIGYSEALAREANDQAQHDHRHERLGDFNKRAAEFANTINQAGHDLLSLINNILDVARIESGRFDLASDRIEIANLIAVCVRHSGAEARAAEVSIWVEVTEHLPVLHGDERRLRQVLSHLLSNAIKFTRPGGNVRISAALGQDGDLLLRVADTGIGITTEDQARVFDPFVQLDTSLSRRAGAGLGLYVARALVAAHGGELTLVSEPGRGTTLTIRLPKQRLEGERRTG